MLISLQRKSRFDLIFDLILVQATIAAAFGHRHHNQG